MATDGFFHALLHGTKRGSESEREIYREGVLCCLVCMYATMFHQKSAEVGEWCVLYLDSSVCVCVSISSQRVRKRDGERDIAIRKRGRGNSATTNLNVCVCVCIAVMFNN